MSKSEIKEAANSSTDSDGNTNKTDSVEIEDPEEKIDPRVTPKTGSGSASKEEQKSK